MDPVSHAIIGAAAALTVLFAARREAPPSMRWTAALAGALAGEAPDADRLLDWWLSRHAPDEGGLAYMLYHRGPTHTVLGCLVAAGLVALGIALLARRVAPPFRLLFVMTSAGALLHLAADWTNDYGIHPFHPISARWFFGDFLFLAEPLLAGPLLPYVLLALGIAKGRRLVIGCAAGGVLVFGALTLLRLWLLPFGAVLAVLWLTVHAALQSRVQRPRLAWMSAALVLAVFFAGSRVARARTHAWLHTEVPGHTVAQIVTTPAPANPFCWRVITATRSGDAFEVRLGATSLLPALVDAKTCFSPPGGIVPQSVCEVAAVTRPETSTITPFAQFKGSAAEFERFAHKNGKVRATRHFLRVPFWGVDAREFRCTEQGRAGPMLIGDLRVDYNKTDLEQYCKYVFAREESATFEPLMPLGDPPFFHSH